CSAHPSRRTSGSRQRSGSSPPGRRPRRESFTPRPWVYRISYMAGANAAAAGPLHGLAATFTYTQARQAGISDRTLYRLRDTGLIQPVGHGLYRRNDVDLSADIDLLEITRRAPQATLCLTTALARHGLTDEIPARIDVALPRGRHRPTTVAPTTW